MDTAEPQRKDHHDARGWALLHRAYEQRLAAARAFKQRGGKVVGIVGHCAPPELAVALDALPVQIAAQLEHATPRADRLMPDNHGWESRSICEQALNGEYDFLDLLVITRPYGPLYYVLREVHRQGDAPGLPPLYLFDLLQSERACFAAYNETCLDAFIARLERLTAARLAEPMLARANAASNAQRGLWRQLHQLRRDARISGSDAMRAIGAGCFMPQASHADALHEAIEMARGRARDATLARRPRLLVVSAEPLFHTALHDALESAGGLVVAEDDFWGVRSGEVDIDEATAPRPALLAQCSHKPASPYPIGLPERAAWLVAQVALDAIDGVVFYVPPSDRSFGWDYPNLKANLDRVGCRSLLLRENVRQPSGREQATAAARTFVAELEVQHG
jgi:benzoyl-CoA reductase/2-hydroxyglutaryl-CoA dehydratase subunit BcrC/BadD/HgdB